MTASTSALEQLISEHGQLGGHCLIAPARHEQAELLALIQTLSLALARAQGIALDDCDGGLLGKAREVLGRYELTNGAKR